MNGTWSSKPPPKIFQTTVGSLLIVVIVLVGLVHESQRARPAAQITIRVTTAPSQSPTPPAPAASPPAAPVRRRAS